MLLEVAEKVLPQAIKPGLLAYCPTMDLIALATRDEQVHVFRLNGQRVFGVSNKSADCKIVQLVWKPNGRVLAVAQSTGNILLINSHTGKITHQVDCTAYSEAQICSLGWSLSFIDALSVRARLEELSKEFTLDDVLSQGLKGLDVDAPLDLPADLAFLDVESILPKLTVLPPTGGREDDIFASRASIDAIFHAAKKDSNDSADVLLVGFEDGSAHLSIYDFFDIGAFSRISGPGQALKVVAQSSHPYSSTHGLLVADKLSSPTELAFVPADLRLITDTGRYLSVLASKATQLQNLLRYMHEARAQVHAEFGASQDLPKKFMRNIEETLQEKESSSFVNGAFHLVATGHCTPSMKEWLTDELGERGQKRWEKAAVSGYENVNKLAFQNLLPAMDRFGVLVSRLRGLSKFQESTSSYGLDTPELELVLDTLNCLRMLAYNVVIVSGAELRLSNAFAKWLKLEIDMQGAEPGSQTAEDLAGKYAGLDYPSIFSYIQGAMLDSELYELFNLQPESDKRMEWKMPPITGEMYDAYKTAVKEKEDGKHEKKLPGLDDLLKRLDQQCKAVFERIAQTQKRKVRFGGKVDIFKGSVACCDAKAVMQERTGEDEEDVCEHYAVVGMEGSPVVTLFKTTLKIMNGVSSTDSVQHASVKFSGDSRSSDVKFADEESVIIAQKTKSGSNLIFLPYNSSAPSTSGLVWRALSEKPHVLDLSSEDKLSPFVRHKFADGKRSTPERIVVNGRKGRRAVCIVAEDGIHYSVLDMDSLLDDNDNEQGMDVEDGL